MCKPDSTGFAGDHFSLEGAIEMFKQSKSVEDFEKRINQESNYVNNLDLNEDGETDYIHVVDHMSNAVHAIVLQVHLNASETQDIAVLEVEKTGKENAVIQIVGDENVYGQEVIVEPYDLEYGSQGDAGGPNASEMAVRIVVNVWAWPSVRYIYGPRYRPWTSPWRWRHYPTWWKPWKPRPWRWHFNRRIHYHNRCHVVGIHRLPTARKLYIPKRRTSVTVTKRTTVIRTNKTVVQKKSTVVAAHKTKTGVVAGSKRTSAVTTKSSHTKPVKNKQTTVRAKKSGNKTVVKKTTRVTKKK